MLSMRNVLCGVLFIAATSSARVEVDDPTFDPILYSDAYSEDDYPDLVDAYEYADRKTKRQTIEEFRSLPGTSLPLSSEKMKELLRLLNKPKKSGIFTLNGWSASGMPFNVLYTPNALQQKYLAAVNAIGVKKPAVPQPQPLQRDSYNSEGKEYARAIGVRTPTQTPQMRRHYLVIPQLFVSYGWGSVGK